jgi:hypothetical protein
LEFFFSNSTISSLNTSIGLWVMGLASNQNSPRPQSLYFTNITSAKLFNWKQRTSQFERWVWKYLLSLPYSASNTICLSLSAPWLNSLPLLAWSSEGGPKINTKYVDLHCHCIMSVVP